ncbi:MAG: CAP domain-containing protein [Acidimicrobiales bacterium]
MPIAGSLHTAPDPFRLLRLTLGALLLVVSLVVTAIVVDASSAGADTTTDEQRFVEKINELRTGLGLPPLTVDAELVAGSRDWTERLRSDGGLSHAPDLSVGVTSYWLKLGENVGVAPQDQLDALFDAFVASPDHYANLIDPDFTFVGVGVLYDDDGRMWTTHRFMELGEQPVAPTPTVPPAATGDASTTTVPAPATTELTPSTTAAAAPETAAPTTAPEPPNGSSSDEGTTSSTAPPAPPAPPAIDAPVATNDLVPARVPLAAEPLAELLDLVAG